MRSNSEITVANFRESAVRSFLFFWYDFELKVKNLNRKEDENVFQQLRTRYAEALKTSLQQTAEKLLINFQGNKQGLRVCLTEQVSHNISAFMGKVDSL
ncbi:hypothetical protein LZZ85_17770 [Terrimonas sp. NA20]|uniref:Uncharacterized protein n=1 Tax=Terrimonas ginsenosidimutans TaxID=2908004 RepID=A0ABS9KV47_9BACT|nr:hypothetical protein [Terrimonas ginsenosidimutans]MCG2616150.1 hypothetical protein [Terrimonas ginsenosidimutans]